MNAPDPSTLYALFVGIIDQQSTKRIVDAIVTPTLPGPASKLVLGFQSTGGAVGDGIFYTTFLEEYLST